MPNLDWAGMLADLGRTGFLIPDLERFNFLITIYRSANKLSSFTLKTLLSWPDFPSRYTAIRILVRVPKEIFDVLAQSERLVIEPGDFAQASPLVKEKAMVLGGSNMNSSELNEAFFLLSEEDDQNAAATFRDEFRTNPELVTLARLQQPVSPRAPNINSSRCSFEQC